MLTNHEIDALAIDEHKSSLGHKAAMHSHLSVLTMLVKEAGMHLNALQLPDENFSTPAMLAIQVGVAMTSGCGHSKASGVLSIVSASGRVGHTWRV